MKYCPMLLFPTIRSLSHKKLLKHLQFIRLQSGPALAHCTPYFSDSGSDDLNWDPNSRNNLTATNYDDFLELNSFGVVKILNYLQKEPFSALSFFNELKREGFQHDVQTYLAIIKILCFWGLDGKLYSLFADVINLKNEDMYFNVSELLEAMAEEIKAEGSNSLNRAFDTLIKSYATLGLFREAMDTLFETKRLRVGLCLFSFNYLMNQLVGHGKIELLELAYKLMKPLGLSPNEYTYGIMIKGYLRKDRLEEAEQLLTEMEKVGVVPDAFIYADCLKVVCRLYGSDKGHVVLKCFEKQNFPIDAYAYNVVIKGFINENKFENAKKVILEMEDQNEMVIKGIKSNCLILTSVLQGLCRKGMHNEVVELFEKTNKRGFVLDKVAYNVAIDAFCKMGKLDEAFWLFDEMKCRNLVPDVVHYTTLIRSCCLHGDICDATYLFQEMIRKGLEADIVCYNVLVDGLSKYGLLDRVYALLDTMKSRGVTPTTVTHNMIIEGLCSGGKLREAEKYFSDLVDKSVENYASMVNGYCLSNNASAGFKFFCSLFNQQILISEKSRLLLLSSLCLEGKTNKAVNLFQILLSSGDGPNKTMYRKIISALCCAGDMERAKWAFQQMVVRGLFPDLITYTIMLNGYLKINCLEEAFDLFSYMKERMITPDIITYTVLLDGCSKTSLKKPHSENANKKVKEMRSTILCEIQKMGLKPDSIYYTTLIDSHCKLGNLKGAISVFNEMVEQGLSPDLITYTVMLNGYCKVNCLEEAFVLFSYMKERGITPDKITYTVLLDGCSKTSLKKSRSENANKKVKEMRSIILCEMEMGLKPDSIQHHRWPNAYVWDAGHRQSQYPALTKNPGSAPVWLLQGRRYGESRCS